MIRTRFDKDSDVLYLSIDAPCRAFVDEKADGLLLRISYETRQPIGLTIISASAHWKSRIDLLASRASEWLKVPADDLKKAISEKIY